MLTIARGPNAQPAATNEELTPHPILKHVYILRSATQIYNGDEIALDLTNKKGQKGDSDGQLSVHDARARGIPDKSYLAISEAELPNDEKLRCFTALFAAHPLPEVKTKFILPDGRKIGTTEARLKKIKSVLGQLRSEVELARRQNKNIVFPLLQNGVVKKNTAVSFNQPTFVVDTESVDKLKLTPDEAVWLHHEFADKTERVEMRNSRAHYMTPQMKQYLVDRINEFYEQVQAAQDANKVVVYLSTFISSLDTPTNIEIAAFIEQRLNSDEFFGPHAWILNPAKHQLIGTALGDDYMWMWENLLGENIFDAVHFTSQNDTIAFFQAKHQDPGEAYLENGTAVRSAGCRYEWRIFAEINRCLAEKGLAHLQIPMFWGGQSVPLPTLTGEVHTVDYSTRGENI